MYLFIDTETNGLPDMTNIKYGNYPIFTNIDKYNTARIIQLSFMLCDENLKELEMHDYIIKRENFEINNFEFHGITNDISDNGIDFYEAINIFMTTLEKCKYIVAHNTNFDLNVIKSEFYRRNMINHIKILTNTQDICTVKKLKYIVKAKNKYNKIKDPSLRELYYYAFNKELENAHNSKYDVINLQKAVKHLFDKKVIKDLK